MMNTRAKAAKKVSQLSVTRAPCADKRTTQTQSAVALNAWGSKPNSSVLARGARAAHGFEEIARWIDDHHI